MRSQIKKIHKEHKESPQTITQGQLREEVQRFAYRFVAHVNEPLSIRWQIRTFWFGLLWISLCVAFIIATIGIGILFAWLPMALVGLVRVPDRSRLGSPFRRAADVCVRREPCENRRATRFTCVRPR